MSYIAGSEPARIHESTPDAGTVTYGQRHDRILLSEQKTTTMAGSGGTDISVTQRMVSATWGSILTSLLGTSPRLHAALC